MGHWVIDAFNLQLLKNLRASHSDLSVVTLSKKIGIDDKELYQYLNGEKKPSTKALKKISTYFGVPISEFITRPAESLQECRTHTGLIMTEAAKEWQMTFAKISNFEQGFTSHPDPKMIGHYATISGLSEGTIHTFWQATRAHRLAASVKG